MNEQWLLTAATCVPDPSADDESVEDMKVEIAKDKEWLDVKQVLLHPEYKLNSNFTAENDMALVKLADKIEFDEVNSPACLHGEPTSNFDGLLTFAGQFNKLLLVTC